MKRWLFAAALCALVTPARAGQLYVQVSLQFTFQNNLTYTANA